MFPYALFLPLLISFSSCQNVDQILTYSNNLDQNGYDFNFQTASGQERSEKGIFNKNILTVSGRYSYLSPEGKRITVTYIANGFGFRPKTMIETEAVLVKPETKFVPFVSSAAIASLTGGGLG